MRGRISFILAGLLIFSLAACGRLESDEAENKLTWEIGDIILTDGSVMKEAELTGVDHGNYPVAVVAGFKADGGALGAGVHRSDGPLQWAEDRAEDKTEAGNGPAFKFAESYAESFGLTGDYGNGWYMPDIDELNMIYQNRKMVNEALERICGFDSGAAMNGLGTDWYWSSTESESEEDYAWFIHFYNGYAGECPQSFTNLHAVAVRIF